MEVAAFTQLVEATWAEIAGEADHMHQEGATNFYNKLH